MVDKQVTELRRRIRIMEGTPVRPRPPSTFLTSILLFKLAAVVLIAVLIAVAFTVAADMGETLTERVEELMGTLPQ